MNVSTEQKAAIGKEVRFACGVQSLPWLILTNKEHIVRAEGFGISELEQMERLTAHDEEDKP